MSDFKIGLPASAVSRTSFDSFPDDAFKPPQANSTVGASAANGVKRTLGGGLDNAVGGVKRALGGGAPFAGEGASSPASTASRFNTGSSSQ